MLDLFATATSVCLLIHLYCFSLIRRRLQEADGIPRSQYQWFFNQWRMFRQYYDVAADHNWSRLPVFVDCSVTVCGMIFCAEVAVQLLPHTLK
jgi:hypothetical protein